MHVEEADHSLWAVVPTTLIGTSASRTLRWLDTVVKTVESKCQDTNYVTFFKKLPTEIGKKIASTKISVASSAEEIRIIYTQLRTYGAADFGTHPWVSEQAFSTACMEFAVIQTIAHGTPCIAADCTDDQRLLIWLIWDLSNAVRQMSVIGKKSEPLDLKASTNERKQRLNFDPVAMCESTCQQMLQQLETWKTELGFGYDLGKNLICEFMRPKTKRSVVDAKAAGKSSHDRKFGLNSFFDPTNDRALRTQGKHRKIKLDAYEEAYEESNMGLDIEIARREHHDEKIYLIRLEAANKFVAGESTASCTFVFFFVKSILIYF